MLLEEVTANVGSISWPRGLDQAEGELMQKGNIVWHHKLLQAGNMICMSPGVKFVLLS